MNTLRDLLNDLALEAQNKILALKEKDPLLVGATDMTDDLVDDYLLRFKEELLNYLGEAK